MQALNSSTYMNGRFKLVGFATYMNGRFKQVWLCYSHISVAGLGWCSQARDNGLYCRVIAC